MLTASACRKKAGPDWVHLVMPDESHGRHVLLGHDGVASCWAGKRHIFRSLRGKKLTKVQAIVERINNLAPDAPTVGGLSRSITIKSAANGSKLVMSYNDQTEVGRELLGLERELVLAACGRRALR